MSRLLPITLIVAAIASVGHAADEHLQLSQIVVTPTECELVQIENLTPRYVDLGDVYLTDATNTGSSTYYYKIVTGAGAGGGTSNDFHARFPAGAVIGPGERQIVSLIGASLYATNCEGAVPTYEMVATDAAVPDMRPALPGSINGSTAPTLTNGGEVVVLYHWDGQSDLVADLDYFIWGNANAAVDKTGVNIDGPDAGTTPSAYLADTAVVSQDFFTGSHGNGDAFERGDDLETGEAQTGGNGITGNNETSEPLDVTWQVDNARYDRGTPVDARLLLTEIAVAPAGAEFVEIHNPHAFPVGLTAYYLTDATDGAARYYNIVTGANAGGGANGDFHALFPDATSIGPGEFQTVALNGSDAFFAAYGVAPTYELFEDAGVPDLIPDMLEALPGSINGQGNLADDGEVLVLYHWAGENDAVGDADYALWGDGAEAVDKTGVTIDAIPSDGLSTSYFADTAVASQAVIAASVHANGSSWQHTDLTEGLEVGPGGNGIDGGDETSENLGTTWDEKPTTPGEGPPPLPALTVVDASVAEGDGGPTVLSFTVSLVDPAPEDITFFAATSDGTATVAGNDYVALAATQFTILMNTSSVNVEVTVQGDTDPEPNENLVLTLSTPVNAVLGDATATGTILADDVLPIGLIQGTGLASAYDDLVVLTGGVVTLVAPSGFAMQDPAGVADGNPASSDGIYVFTGAAPTVTVGQLVEVVGLVDEYFELTEITGSPVVMVVGTAPVPAPVNWGATVPSPDPSQPSCAGGIEYECYEGMVVTGSGVVVAGSQSFGGDPMAEFSAVAVPTRPMREIGAEYPGLGGSIPVYDGNPEVFEIDPNKFGLPNLEVDAGATWTGTGMLGFEFGDYELWPSALSVDAGPGAVEPVPAAFSDELTLGSLNMFRFFDDIDDPVVDDTVVSTVEYQRRRTKFRRYILDVLGAPAVVGVQEAEKLAVLQALAADIAAANPAVVYTAYLAEGFDVGGIDVGFLVREDIVAVNAVTQLATTETYINPITMLPELLHDRPPYLLEGTWASSHGPAQVAFMVNHTRSLGGIEAPVDGARVRAKRLAQGQSIGALVQNFQTATPNVPLVVFGDLNAYEFTDGYVDVVGQMRGTAVASENLVWAAPVTSPVLANEVLFVDPAERYSYVFDGSAQVLDHALTTRAAQRWVRDFVFGHGNADAAVNAILDDSTAKRCSDHDGFVLYLSNRIFVDGFESGTTGGWSTSVP